MAFAVNAMVNVIAQVAKNSRLNMSRKYLGYVEWFDKYKGEGLVYCPEKKSSYYLHWSAIKTPQESFIRTLKVLSKFSAVEFTLYENLYLVQIDSVWEVYFNYSVENEWKINRLMNDLFEDSNPACLDISNKFYENCG